MEITIREEEVFTNKNARVYANSGQTERMALEEEGQAENLVQPALSPELANRKLELEIRKIEIEIRKLEIEIRKLEIELEIEKAKAGGQKAAPETQVRPVEAPEIEPRTNTEVTETKPVAQKPEPEIIEAETTAEEPAPVSKAKNSTTVHPPVSAADIYEIADDDDFDYEAFEV